ncbi:MAG TPA: MMPL family transporter [Phycisphaerae bacterium]|nr:MMPL family transporter [Phycisphaerae bacterium]
MRLGSYITAASIRHYRLVTLIMVVATVVVLLAAGLPSLRLIDGMPGWITAVSDSLSFMPAVEVDTDPENMLSPDEPVRVFHNEMKRRMALHDIVVVGVVNEEHPQGVFNPESLRKVYELTVFAKKLQFDEKGKRIEKSAGAAAAQREPVEPAGIGELEIPGLDGVTEQPRIAPAPRRPARTAQRGVIPGDVIAPSTVDSIEPRGGAIVFDWLMRSPPATQAEANDILRRAQRVPFLNGTMVSADGKAVALYLPITDKHLSYNVYRELRAKIAALGEGPEQFHITGLPVAEDTFGVEMFVQMAISAPAAMVVIFVLMLAFFRKLIVVIPPMIVAMVSVILTMGVLVLSGKAIHIMSSMIPIFIMPIAVMDSIHIISEFFEKYQATRDRRQTMRAVMDDLFMPMLYTSLTSAAGFASLALTPIPPVQVFGLFVAGGVMAAWVLTVTFIPAFVMFIPPSWLENFGSRPRAADGSGRPGGVLGRVLYWMGGATVRRAKPILAVALIVLAAAGYGISRININDNPVKWFTGSHPIRVADRVLNEHFGGTYMAYLAMEADANAGQVFKQPEVLRWQARLQEALAASGVVGKSNSLADIVKTVYRDLLAADVDDPNIERYYTIPDSPGRVADCLMQFQSSNRRDDIDHFVTPDYRTCSLWVQLTSGDNRDMAKAVRAASAFLATDPPPAPIRTRWFGLTYINVVWQDKMVVGMLHAFAGSFLVVFLLMAILFRSALWGLLSMIPLTVTLGAIYGALGLIGKDYDMPVAVLSSLTLGLAVDFAIHFLARSREMQRRYGAWQATSPHVFGEPARAIARNIIVIAAGFMPLLLAPLVPYKTVGVLLATILLVSGVGTLVLLPALIRVTAGRLFRPTDKVMPAGCNCGLCAVISAAAAVLIALNLYSAFGWGTLTWISVAAIPVLALICGLMSRREKCRLKQKTSSSEGDAT